MYPSRSNASLISLGVKWSISVPPSNILFKASYAFLPVLLTANLGIPFPLGFKWISNNVLPSSFS